jgi:hypothetical protein
MKLDYLNKNWYRAYPLRATSKHVTENGSALPYSFFAGARITTKPGFENVFIRRIFVVGPYVNIDVAAKNLNTNVVTGLGYFAARLTKDNTTITMQPLVDYASGFLVLGRLEDILRVQGNHTLSFDNGRIEDCLIYPFNPPAVHSIQHDGAAAKGKVTFVLDNFQHTGFVFGVVNPDRVASNADQSSQALNCGGNVIKAINSVEPDEDGNIDIFAIEPITLELKIGGIKLDTPTLTAEDICGNINENIPPVLEDNTYNGFDEEGNPKTVLEATVPEWKALWPQYN